MVVVETPRFKSSVVVGIVTSAASGCENQRLLATIAEWWFGYG